MPVATKRFGPAGDCFNQPRRGVQKVTEDATGVFFYMAGKQFVLLIDSKTQVELGVYVIRNGHWEQI